MHFFRRSLVVRPPGRSRCAMCYKSYIVEQAKVEWRWRRTRTDKNMPWIRTRVTISPNCLLLLLAILRCHKFNLQAPQGSVLLLVCALFNHTPTKEKRAKTIRSLKKCRGSHPTNLIPNIIHTRSGGCCTTNFFSFFFALCFHLVEILGFSSNYVVQFESSCVIFFVRGRKVREAEKSLKDDTCWLQGLLWGALGLRLGTHIKIHISGEQVHTSKCLYL